MRRHAWATLVNAYTSRQAAKPSALHAIACWVSAQAGRPHASGASELEGHFDGVVVAPPGAEIAAGGDVLAAAEHVVHA
eukprot:CAMPEP_0176334330 /NCGR_PEP_ID=MMETSP0121_2-20121125/78048_1 /TAXON_ID=160619 /ORGANISM="Kryptoperidinium foliaceum, Strain CCMP 1326" /LENGTH=78 /DNA_ID=CAMNT_0017677279 /DNA_START=425 /DNA_END=658 /DNA_ORIENTATION=-